MKKFLKSIFFLSSFILIGSLIINYQLPKLKGVDNGGCPTGYRPIELLHGRDTSNNIVNNICMNMSSGRLLLLTPKVSNCDGCSATQIIYDTTVDITATTNTGPGDRTKGILNWSTTPITVIAAPGSGKFIQVLGFSFEYKAGATAYIEPAPQNITLFWTGPNPFCNGVSATGLLMTTTTSQMFPSLVGFQALNSGVALADINGNAMFIGDTGGSGNLTTGDGSVRITVQYTIENIL